MVVVTAVHSAGLRWQQSGSLPRGIYRLMPGAPIERGVLAVWCLPQETAAWARARGYLSRGPCTGDAEAVAKQAVAVPGDTVDIDEAGVAVNGRRVPRSVRLARDSRGRVLPMIPAGRYVMRQGEYWLASSFATQSFDSRYFGPVASGGLIGVARPILTW